MAWWIDWTRMQIREIIEIPNEPVTITINYPPIETILAYIPLLLCVGIIGNFLCWWTENRLEYFLDKRIRIHERKLERKRMMEMWHP